MARPQKDGLDYFSLDTDMDRDDKIELIEAGPVITAGSGIAKFGIVIKVLMKIYREGYFYEWSERNQLLFANRINVDINSINVVINDCLWWNFFHQGMYEKYKILTSKGIQKRFLEAVKRRKEITMVKEFALIDTVEYSKKFNLDIVLVSVNNNPINVDINSINDDIGTQSNARAKGKKSKVKKSIAHFNDFFEERWKKYPLKKGKGQVSDTQKEKLFKVGAEKIDQAIERYKKDKPEWQEYMHGSTFFNSGYIDYLDENYQQEKPERTLVLE